MWFVAFYHGKGDINDWIVRLATNSRFSHCELVRLRDDGQYDCYSSSARDKGVRHKVMDLPSDKWTLVPVQVANEYEVIGRFNTAINRKYDYKGVLRFALPFLSSGKDKWFCSELVAYMLKYPSPHSYTPKDLYGELTGRWE